MTRKVKKKRINTKMLLLWISSALAFFIAAVILFSLAIKLVLGVSSFEGFGLITYSVSVKNEDYKENSKSSKEYITESKIVSASTVIRGSVAYFDFTAVALDCDARVSGDETRIRYIFDKGEATFFFDSTLAYIGGEAVILEAPCYYDGEKLFIPATAARYMYGLTVTYKNRKLSVKYDPAEVRPANLGEIDKPTKVTDD